MLGLGGMFQNNFMGNAFLFIMVRADGPRRITMNFQVEILCFFGPTVKSRNFGGNGSYFASPYITIHLSQSQNSNF